MSLSPMSLSDAIPISFIMTRSRQSADPFYEQQLGLTRLPGDDFAAVFDLGRAGLLRITEVPDFTPSAHPALGWQVNDIEASVTALTARGVVFTVYDGFGQDALGIWTSPDGAAKVAWFQDPDGNVLSLTQC